MISFATWSRGELLIADYLLAWAIPRIHESWRVELFVNRRAQLRHAIEDRDSQILHRFLHCLPPDTTTKGLQYGKLNAILQRIIERQPF